MRKGRKGRNKEMKKEEEGRGSKEGGKMVRSERNRKIQMRMGFPGGPVKNPPANVGHMSSIPGPGRSHVPWSI